MKYEVKIIYSSIVEAKNEEEAERYFWEMFDNSYLKAKVSKVDEE